MPGSIPAHTSLLLALPLRSLPRRRAQAVATKSPEMPIFFSRFNSLLAHKVRSPPPSSTAAAPQIIRALPDSPSRGGRDLPFRSGLSRLPCKPGSQMGWERRGPVRGAVAAASAPEFAVSRLLALRYPQQPTWAFWCASCSGTALQPPGLPALPSNGQAGSQ